MDEVRAYVEAGQRRQRRWIVAGSVATAVAALIIIVVWLVISSNAVPVGDRRARQALESEGMKDILLGGSSPLACAENESSRHFEATNATGARVSGTVCCGLTGVGKTCTVRWGR